MSLPQFDKLNVVEFPCSGFPRRPSESERAEEGEGEGGVAWPGVPAGTRLARNNPEPLCCCSASWSYYVNASSAPLFLPSADESASAVSQRRDFHFYQLLFKKSRDVVIVVVVVAVSNGKAPGVFNRSSWS